MTAGLIIWAVVVVLFAVGVWFALRSHKRASSVVGEYARLSSEFAEVDAQHAELDKAQVAYTQLQSFYQERKRVLVEARHIVAQYDIGIGTADENLVQLIHSIGDIERIELDLADVKERAKEMVKDKTACVCNMGDNITINGRKAGVKTLFNREVQLRLRCFDNEVKAAIALASWNNIGRLNERVKRAYDEINIRGDLVKTYLDPRYRDLRLRELNLSFELAELKALKKEEEREQRRIEREAEREEQKIKAAAEKAKRDLERMEKLVEKELAKLDTLTQDQREEFELLQQELEALKSREQRAVSMAQHTRAGFVYVISNNTSFGEGVIKVGMTRRADPNERVRELSDASVPDTFDVHGFFYCEDAPQLESDIHKTFDSERVNLINKRKEFFYIEPQAALTAIERHGIETTRVDAA